MDTTELTRQAGYKATGPLPAGHSPVRKGRIGVLLVNLGTPDGTDYGLIRFCFAKNETTLSAAGERLRAVWVPSRGS